jgi:hypothetical protein
MASRRDDIRSLGCAIAWQNIAHHILCVMRHRCVADEALLIYQYVLYM